MDGVIGFSNYKQYKESLDQELSRSAESFVRIGYLLKVARDMRQSHSLQKQSTTFARIR